MEDIVEMQIETPSPPLPMRKRKRSTTSTTSSARSVGKLPRKRRAMETTRMKIYTKRYQQQLLKNRKRLNQLVRTGRAKVITRRGKTQVYRLLGTASRVGQKTRVRRTALQKRTRRLTRRKQQVRAPIGDVRKFVTAKPVTRKRQALMELRRQKRQEEEQTRRVEQAEELIGLEEQLKEKRLSKLEERQKEFQKQEQERKRKLREQADAEFQRQKRQLQQLIEEGKTGEAAEMYETIVKMTGLGLSPPKKSVSRSPKKSSTPKKSTSATPRTSSPKKTTSPQAVQSIIPEVRKSPRKKQEKKSVPDAEKLKDQISELQFLIQSYEEEEMIDEDMSQNLGEKLENANAFIEDELFEEAQKAIEEVKTTLDKLENGEL